MVEYSNGEYSTSNGVTTVPGTLRPVRRVCIMYVLELHCVIRDLIGIFE